MILCLLRFPLHLLIGVCAHPFNIISRALTERPFFEYLGVQFQLLIFRGREQYFCVSGAQLPFGEAVLYFFRKIEKPERVCYCCSFFAYFFCEIRLFQLEFVNKNLVGLCLFDRVEVFALNIFDQGDCVVFFFICLYDNSLYCWLLSGVLPP